MLRKIAKEPLVHFLLAGFFLFVYFKSCSNDMGAENTIHIDKVTMLDFMQYQSKAFNQEVFEDKLNQLPPKEKNQLIQNYIQEEALYREAVKIGLNQNDFVIKRRVIQKMEFMLNDFDESSISVLEDSLQTYYQKYQQRYFKPAQYTFTHIFFKKGKQNAALERAEAFMQVAAHRQLTNSESLPFGDRFLYHRNYAEKDQQFLESQFGEQFTKTLETLDAKENKWQGPIASEHGQHWIKLAQKSVANIAELSDIRSVVEADYLGYLKQQYKQQQIQKLIKRYDVVIDL